MVSKRLIIGIDPGTANFGYVVFVGTEMVWLTTYRSDVFLKFKEEVLDNKRRGGFTNGVFVCENYRPQPWRGPIKVNKVPDLIEDLSLFADSIGYHFVLQDPSKVKRAFSEEDIILYLSKQNYPKRHSSHARDAIKHALYYMGVAKC